MTSRDELKRAVCEAIDRQGNEIIELGERILHHPETGFNEDKTAALSPSRCANSGWSRRPAWRSPGSRAGCAAGIRARALAVIGELDSLRTSDHPLADPHTGAAHSCGHNARSPACSAPRWASRRSAPPSTSPANWSSSPSRPRSSSMSRSASHRKERGEIEFLLGKPELVANGHFDDIDMAMMIHAGSHDQMTKRSFIAD